MPSHLFAGSLLLRCRRRGESFKQSRCCGNVLARPGERQGALPVFGNFSVDLAHVGAGGSSIGMAAELTLKRHVFLLQLEPHLLKLLLPIEELNPPLVCGPLITLHRRGWVAVVPGIHFPAPEQGQIVAALGVRLPAQA